MSSCHTGWRPPPPADGSPDCPQCDGAQLAARRAHEQPLAVHRFVHPAASHASLVIVNSEAAPP